MLSTGSRTAPYRGRSAAFGWARAGELGILQDRQGLTRCPRKMFPLPRDPAVYPSPLHFKKFASRSPLPSLGQRRSPRNSCTSFFPRIFPPAPPPEPEHTSPQAVDVPPHWFPAPGWGGMGRCLCPSVCLTKCKDSCHLDTTLITPSCPQYACPQLLERVLRKFLQDPIPLESLCLGQQKPCSQNPRVATRPRPDRSAYSIL